MNKFITYSDKVDPNIEAMLPPEWWSRPYEYTFALQFMVKNAVVLDAGCGIEHPFKWLLADKAKKVYAVDCDERIQELINKVDDISGVDLSRKVYKDCKKDKDNIEYIQAAMEIVELPQKVDTVFCISVLEHLPADIQLRALDNFFKLLKDGGKLILTVDYPTIKPDILVNAVTNAGFTIGKTEYDPDNRINISINQYQLFKVFTLVAEKPKKKAEKQAEVV